MPGTFAANGACSLFDFLRVEQPARGTTILSEPPARENSMPGRQIAVTLHMSPHRLTSANLRVFFALPTASEKEKLVVLVLTHRGRFSSQA